MSTFVSVGNANQPFSRLLAAVSACADRLPKPIVVQHGHTPFDDPRCEAHAFLDMEQFASHVREAEVVIVHAGAGSVLHAVRAGRVPIVMARRAELDEHVDDHQQEFARELHDAGRVVMIANAEEMAGALSMEMRSHDPDHGADGCRLVTRVAEILAGCEADGI